MNPHDLKYLQEAYMEVFINEERDESHPHWETNRQFKKSQKKNQELVSKAQERKKDRERNRNPRFGPSGKMTKTQREQVDIYDIILSHLIDEGYANCLGSAEIILENMSDEWLDDILEGFVDPESDETPSGRRPIDTVAEHPKEWVRRKAMIKFARQMGIEYGDKWKAKTKDPTKD